MTDPNLPLPFADDVETVPADEADDIQRVVHALELLLARSQAKSGQFRADVHVKTHGYAHGELRVLPNLQGELAQGLFEQAGVYPAGSPAGPLNGLMVQRDDTALAWQRSEFDSRWVH